MSKMIGLNDRSYYVLFIELDDGKIYRKAPYLMVKTHGFPVKIFPSTNPVRFMNDGGVMSKM